LPRLAHRSSIISHTRKSIAQSKNPCPATPHKFIFREVLYNIFSIAPFSLSSPWVQQQVEWIFFPLDGGKCFSNPPIIYFFSSPDVFFFFLDLSSIPAKLSDRLRLGRIFNGQKRSQPSK
jgi:hypothetical protein